MNDYKVILGLKMRGWVLDILWKSMRLCSRVQLVICRSDQGENGKYRLLVLPTIVQQSSSIKTEYYGSKESNVRVLDTATRNSQLRRIEAHPSSRPATRYCTSELRISL
jgi:hypothetical protein